MNEREYRNPPSDSDQVMAELDHELVNVVNGLLGMARLLRESGLSAEQDCWLEAIEHSGRQLGRLVDAFRRHGASPGTPLRVHATHLDGVKLLDQVLISHAPAARSGGNQLLLIVSPELSRHWYADPCLLRQVLDNLLGNAVKFTRSGTILVEAAAEAADGSSRATLILRVSDSGPGVDEALGERVFDAYCQGHEARSLPGPESGPDPGPEPGPAPRTRPGEGGRGLGLSICRNIASAIGGSIAFCNSEFGGACFELRAPGVVAAERAAALPTPRLLRTLRCQISLAPPARRSVAAILSRIGVRWSVQGFESIARDALVIEIGAAPAGAFDPGPNLALRVAGPRRGRAAAQTLLAPVLESRLGPLLLQMALEALSAPDEGKG